MATVKSFYERKLHNNCNFYGSVGSRQKNRLCRIIKKWCNKFLIMKCESILDVSVYNLTYILSPPCFLGVFVVE